MDPFKSNEILISILSHLSAQELLLASGVSKDFYLATSSESLWCILLKKLWENKVYVPTRAKELSSRSSKWAYLYSILDSKRQFLRNDDLVSHTWSFRFKSTSGQDWIQVCPWNQGLAASEVMFLSSGRVLRLGNASMNELYSRLRLSWRIDKKHVSIRQNKHILDFLSLYERFEALYRGTKYLRDDDKLSLQLGDIGEVLYLKVNC